jgi:hypothetical protein
MESPSTELIKQLSRPLAQGKGWMKFVGVLTIIYGVLIALSIIGLIFAWLPIWIGIVLFQSATAIEEAEITGNQEAMLKALAKLRTYFTIMGVITLIGLLFFALMMVIGVTGGMLGMMGNHSY